jgi:iron complex outermembrane receptor protein
MTTIVHRARLAALPLALAAAFPSSSFAQTATLPETVVTATRFAEPAQSLPLGVSVITAEEIRASGANTINEALMRLLGVVGRQDFYGGGEYNLDLRGFGTTADNNQVIVVDGQRLSEGDLGGTRLSGIPIEAVESIEVLRGSGAVLYGEGATGGVIVVTTKAGSGRQQRTGGYGYAAAGSNHLRDLRAGVTAAGSGFALNADAQTRNSDNHRDNFRSELQSGSVTGQWSNEWLRLGARFGEDLLDARLPGGITEAQFDANPRQTNTPDDRAHIRNQRTGLFARAELGSWQLAFDAGKRHKNLTSLNSGFPFDYNIDADTYALRARHEAKLGGVNNVLVLGADYGDWRRELLGAFGSVATQRNGAVYAKDDVTLQGGTRLSVGARTERIRKDSSGMELDDRQNAWELGVSQPLPGNVTAYGRIGRSFRLANVDEFSFTAPGAVLQPQTSRDVELGARWKHADSSVDARLYRSHLTNEIGFDPNAAGTFFGANVNFDPTRRQGLEVDAKHALTRTVDLRANLALRRATFRAGPYVGNDVPLVPRRSLALRADWKPAAEHRLSGGVTWVSSQHSDFNNTCSVPSYAVADLRYAYQWKQAEFALGVGNLFDRKYYTQAFQCAAGINQSVYPEAGRTFTASVRVTF